MMKSYQDQISTQKEQLKKSNRLIYDILHSKSTSKDLIMKSGETPTVLQTNWSLSNQIKPAAVAITKACLTPKKTICAVQKDSKPVKRISNRFIPCLKVNG